MTGRDSLGRFTRGNTISRQGFDAMLNRHFDGDRAAFNSWFAQLGKWSYGLAYRRQGVDSHYYPRWVKTCFRLHPGRPADFMRMWRAGGVEQDINFMEGTR